MPKIDHPIAGRKVDEWIGKTPDSRPPQVVLDRVFLRYSGRCHISNRKIMTGDKWEADHVKPLWKGGENRESNLAPALVDSHQEKTAEEATARSKADRVRRKLVTGTWPKSKVKIKGRGFPKTRDI